RREDRPEVTLPPRKRLDIALGPRDFRVEDSLAGADQSPTGTGDSLVDTGCHFTGTAGTC
nr:hypothetical protein [Tanacetum cinerariifolium]